MLVLPMMGACAYAARPGADAAAPSVADDSVAVGYGMASRRDVTSAIGTVMVSRAEAARVGRVEELLIGRVAGVDVQLLPNGDYAVRIRGASSMLNGGDPLYVVDGTPFPPGVSPRALLRTLNPGDVDRIDVLKDGAAAAYGIRGGNGVILITTRRSSP